MAAAVSTSLARQRKPPDVQVSASTGPQEDIAGLTGTSRATVNRVLRAEQRNGTITLARGKVLIEDLGGLSPRG